jgi:hypothetical protein
LPDDDLSGVKRSRYLMTGALDHALQLSIFVIKDQQQDQADNRTYYIYIRHIKYREIDQRKIQKIRNAFFDDPVYVIAGSTCHKYGKAPYQRVIPAFTGKLYKDKKATHYNYRSHYIEKPGHPLHHRKSHARVFYVVDGKYTFY